MAQQTKIRTLADAIIVGAVAAPGAFVPGPWHAGISKALAPNKKSTAVATKSVTMSYTGWAISLPIAAALKGRKGMGRYISQQAKAIALLKGKKIKSGLKMIARAQKPFFAAGVVGTSSGAAYGHYTGVQKEAMFEKLGFQPAAFARRVSPHENLLFVERFQQTPASAKTTGAVTSPLVLGLGAITYLFGRDIKSKDEAKTDTVRKPKGFLPKFTMFLTALIATKRWKEATQKDKLRFTREYNASMGTSYRPDHPKMQSLWELMRKGPGRSTLLSKYATKIPLSSAIRTQQLLQSTIKKHDTIFRTAVGVLKSTDISLAKIPAVRDIIKNKAINAIYHKSRASEKLMHMEANIIDSLIKTSEKRKRSSLGDHMAYLKYITSHKFNVLKAGREIGVPTTMLLAHDLSKFKPTEWKPYVDYWFGPEGKTGTNNPVVKKRFRTAAKKHYRRNPHHYHKIQKYQPMKNQLEALADWYSVNRTMHYRISKTKFPTISQWFENKKDTLIVTDDLRDYMSNRP